VTGQVAVNLPHKYSNCYANNDIFSLQKPWGDLCPSIGELIQFNCAKLYDISLHGNFCDPANTSTQTVNGVYRRTDQLDVMFRAYKGVPFVYTNAN
jgi:hypothetical protein